MKSTFKSEDVEFLLTDMTGKIEPITLEEKKKRVEQGEYDRSILTKEFPVTKEYLDICLEWTPIYAKQTAIAVGNLAEQLYKIKNKNLVLVSILRAGTNVGILVKRYLKNKYKINIPHYSMSLIKELDSNSMNYLLSKHRPEDIQFIDGWTGKGTVTKQLLASAKKYEGVDSSLAVLSDSINIAKYCGIREDIAIPQSPFNACITGLVSMPIHNNPFVGEKNFDGAIYLEDLEKIDKSQEYIDLIEKNFDYQCSADNYNDDIVEVAEINEICENYNISLKALNPGINEAARAILRRNVSKLLVKDKKDFQVLQISKLAELKNIEIEEYSFKYYKAATISMD